MTRRTIRCAIYTRKSSEDGLEQEFNSLDAQFEACAAYIASQRHEGWKLLPQRYDDGGVSGGTLGRPGLQRLLGEIDAGRIDMVVVYKIDRLTRSLADFARLVDRLDAKTCSFVSVTQAFNTSTSMGRLTLNVLLSFAQFEREVTAERIRDKIAASKKKGLWMGGLPPLGYDPHPDPMTRALVVNNVEADVVRQLFALYARLGCLRSVEVEAARLELHSKRHVFASGRNQGGGPLSRGQIYHLLRNPVYRGLIRHKEKTFPGVHPPIIDEELWQRVQGKLQSASRKRRGGVQTSGALLAGRIRDETGDLLTPTHTQRHGRRLRYYVSNRLISGGPDPSGWRLPAAALEDALVTLVARHLEESAAGHRITVIPAAGKLQEQAMAVTDLANRLRADMTLMPDLLVAAELAEGEIALTLDGATLAGALKLPQAELHPDLLCLVAPFHLRRRGVEIRIIAGDLAATPDATLCRALRKAHRWADAMREGIALALLAEREGVTEAYIRMRVPLALLSPKIQSVILNGTQPPELTLERIVRTALPVDWQDQERLLGVA
jgi:DNA invertase Pin-like site-specific DNA recombinase